ncbi:hypothetical protein BVX98_06435 [bacterium F11]|nr:hypothetical protein BVX98_06435 [bacterium F11]
MKKELKLIKKRSDPQIKHLRQIRDGVTKSYVFCEGVKLIEEYARSGFSLKTLVCLKTMEGAVENLKRIYHIDNVPVQYVTSEVMDFVSDLASPPGILAIGERPEPSRFEPLPKEKFPLILVIHQIQLPQNMGALIRTAEATGVTEVWTTNRTADPYGPKVLRGSMGSVFRVAIRTGLDLHTALKTLNSQHVHVIGATQEGKRVYSGISWIRPTALILGSEGSGLSIEETKYMNDTIRIPMLGKVESLNVGIAAAVCLFEASKQRRTALKTLKNKVK